MRLDLMGLVRGVVLMVGLAATAAAGVIAVPAEQPTVAAAMLAAAAGDTIQLAPGTYQEHGIDLVAGVTVLGDPDDPGQVVLDAAGQGRVFDADQLAVAPVLSGLTFTGGLVQGNLTDGLGGAVRCRSSALVVSDCVFTDNEATVGGGLGCFEVQLTLAGTVFHANRALGQSWAAGGGLYVDLSSGTVIGCDFVDNTAFAVAEPGDAAGFYSEQSTLLVQGCTFTGNSTGAGGAGFYSYLEDSPTLEDCHFENNQSDFGGAIYLENSSAVLRRCTVVGNTARQAGGLQVDDGSVAELVDCSFVGNVATEFSGGGMGAWTTDLTLTGCEFRDNQAAIAGGALFVRGGSPRLEHCLIAGNTAATRGGAIDASLNLIEIVNCTLAANAAPSAGGVSARQFATVILGGTIVALSTQGESLVADANSQVIAACTTIHGNAGGDWLGDWAGLLGSDGNTDLDPRFCDPLAGDYHLALDSPCAEANNPGCGQVGALPVGCGPLAAPDAATVPTAPRIVGNTPNPFNPRTVIELAVPAPSRVRVAIHDLRGRRLRVLLDAPLAAGGHTVTWDGRDAAGGALASGVYLVVVEGDGQRDARKITMAR